MYVSYTHAGGEKRESKSPKLEMFGDISLKWGVFCFIYFTGEVNEKKKISWKICDEKTMYYRLHMYRHAVSTGMPSYAISFIKIDTSTNIL